MQVPKSAGALIKECIADHLLVVTWDPEAHALCQRMHHPLLCFQVFPMAQPWRVPADASPSADAGYVRQADYGPSSSLTSHPQ